MEGTLTRIPRENFDAFIFDMDGVVTRTATLHFAAWKRLFDDVLSARLGPGETLKPFTDEDYLHYVDGKPRYDGVNDFLRSRDIQLPFGKPGDAPGDASVCALGNRKDVYFWQIVAERGIDVFASTVELIRALKGAGIKAGIFSASTNAERVLTAGGVLDLFDARVDGGVASDLALRGKPQPDMLLELTRRLGTVPKRTAVVEDALAGVQAGRAGGFALVVGVNRTPTAGRLLRAGADVEVGDLGELELEA